MPRPRSAVKDADRNPAPPEFVEAAEACRGRLFAVAMRRCHNPDKAGDLVQETLLKACLYWETFIPGSNMRAWLFTILKNTNLSDMRKSGRMVEDPDDAFATRLTATDNVHGSLDLDDCLEAMRYLSPRQREVLLRLARGETLAVIAGTLNIPVGTVKSSANRARSRLAEVLSGDHDHEPWQEGVAEDDTNGKHHLSDDMGSLRTRFLAIIEAPPSQQPQQQAQLKRVASAAPAKNRAVPKTKPGTSKTQPAADPESLPGLDSYFLDTTDLAPDIDQAIRAAITECSGDTAKKPPRTTASTAHATALEALLAPAILTAVVQSLGETIQQETRAKRPKSSRNKAADATENGPL
jgi:RNA polymerase sigma-70 factor (ECF subfamily)